MLDMSIQESIALRIQLQLVTTPFGTHHTSIILACMYLPVIVRNCRMKLSREGNEMEILNLFPTNSKDLC